jgi:hypothetical protein
MLVFELAIPASVDMVNAGRVGKEEPEGGGSMPSYYNPVPATCSTHRCSALSAASRRWASAEAAMQYDYLSRPCLDDKRKRLGVYWSASIHRLSQG